MRALILAFSAVIIGGAAFACPDPEAYGERYTFSSDDLYTERTLSVTAGGGTDLDYCPNIPGTGQVISDPDFSIRYNKTEQYDLRFQVEGECDTVLLVNDAGANWHFDDDTSNEDPQLWLRNAADGWIDVWIGTYGDSSCAARLNIESFDR